MGVASLLIDRLPGIVVQCNFAGSTHLPTVKMSCLYSIKYLKCATVMVMILWLCTSAHGKKKDLLVILIDISFRE